MKSLSKVFKLRGVGQVAFAFDPHGASKKVRVAAGQVFQTNLSAKVLRDAEYMIDGKRVHAIKLRDYTPEEQARKEYIEGTGHYVRVRNYFGGNRWQCFLYSVLYRNKTSLDLGSGLVTNVGVLALANDWAWSVTNAPNNLFRFLKYHASGTGATAAAATDIKLQTASGFGGQTPVAGTQVLVSAANLQKYQSVATIAYTGTEAVTEWGFFAYDSALPTTANLSDATGSPFTAGSATTGTVTATPLTASSTTAMGQQMSIFERTSGTNLSYGLVTSNTTSVVTVPAWYLVATGAAGQAPANTETYVIRPVMWDHKVFSAINVVNGDSIQYTYTLTVTSGG